MREPSSNTDDKSRDAASKIRIAFDDRAWNKMEALLNAENTKHFTTRVPNNLTEIIANNSGLKWLHLFLAFFLTGALLLLITHTTILENKTIPLVSRYKTIEHGNEKPLGHKTNRDIVRRPINKYQQLLQPGKSIPANKNFKPKATNDKKMPLSTTVTNSYKMNKTISNKKTKFFLKRGGLPAAYVNAERHIEYDLLWDNQNRNKKLKITKTIKKELTATDIDALKKAAPQESFINQKSKDTTNGNDYKTAEISLDIYQKDSPKTATANKRKQAASPFKDRLFKNIGLTIFASSEVNSVKFKEAGKITINYGAGINYNLGKHFTLQAQFAKTRKAYITDRKGYTAPSGSSFIAMDSLKVNADCEVWDIPLNIKYSFKDNTENSFFMAAGISSYIMKKEIYDFSYYDQGVYKTNQRIIENENKHNFCNLNLSAGYQYLLNNKWSLEFEPYLKLPLNGIGAGKVKLTSAGVLFGLTFKPM